MEPCTLDDLKEIGAYLTGHFLLTTGRHSDQFFLLARLTERPDRLEPWVRQLAGRLSASGIKTVVGPAVGGIIPAYAVGREIDGARVLFAEKTDGGRMRFKRGFHLTPGEPVAVVEDAVTTGNSVNKVIEAVQERGGVVRRVLALVDRSEGQAVFPCEFEAVLKVKAIPNWEPETCPLCLGGIALTRPKA